MGDVADDDRERWEDDDYDHDDGDDGSSAFERTHRVPANSHARRAPAGFTPVNVGPARAIAESAAGLRVVREGHEPEWMPRKFVDPTSQVKTRGDAGDLVVSAWIAQQKGWRAVDAPPRQIENARVTDRRAEALALLKAQDWSKLSTERIEAAVAALGLTLTPACAAPR